MRANWSPYDLKSPLPGWSITQSKASRDAGSSGDDSPMASTIRREYSAIRSRGLFKGTSRLSHAKARPWWRPGGVDVEQQPVGPHIRPGSAAYCVAISPSGRLV